MRNHNHDPVWWQLICDVGRDLLLVRDNAESFGPMVVGPSYGHKWSFTCMP